MLVYHFGSKQELERQLISLLETRLRDQLWSFQQAVEGTTSLAQPLLGMWNHLTSPEMHGLLKLSMYLNQQAIQGDAETQAFVENESQKWINFLFDLTDDETTALLLFHLFQGAILDFLATRNAQRGQQTIEAFIKTLR